MKFTIAIEAGTKKTAFGVVVPDLPGCFSAGDTVEEAFDNARDIIDTFCKIRADEGKKLPKPKSMSEWQADKEYEGWAWGIIEVSVERYFARAEKINITVPASTLERIDAYAEKIGESRSGFLVRAAEEVMSNGPHQARPCYGHLHGPWVGQKVSVDFGGMAAEGKVVEAVDGVLSVVVVINVDSKGIVESAGDGSRAG